MNNLVFYTIACVVISGMIGWFLCNFFNRSPEDPD